jgi:hypothetical protein
VDAEDNHREDVEEDPGPTFEDLELQLVDITDWDCRNAGVRCPEKLKLKESLEVDEVWWWTDHVGLTVTETELEQMDCHVRQEQDS